jgi:hypothetical protein
MWINQVAPERLAELFHHYHQAKAAVRGTKFRKRRKADWLRRRA